MEQSGLGSHSSYNFFHHFSAAMHVLAPNRPWPFPGKNVCQSDKGAQSINQSRQSTNPSNYPCCLIGGLFIHGHKEGSRPLVWKSRLSACTNSFQCVSALLFFKALWLASKFVSDWIKIEPWSRIFPLRTKQAIKQYFLPTCHQSWCLPVSFAISSRIGHILSWTNNPALIELWPRFNWSQVHMSLVGSGNMSFQ